jgi:hypothetical protein
MTQGDVYSREGIAYFDALHTNAIALQLMYSSLDLFKRAYRIQHLPVIRAEIQAVAIHGFGAVQYNSRFIHELLLDAIKISTCFENYIKARLLLNGYVIHAIRRDMKGYENLAKQQRTMPVTISDLKSVEGYVYDPKLGVNTLRGISPHTLTYSLLIGNQNYIATHGVPQGIIDILNQYNETRNTLHFLGSTSSRYDRRLLQEIDALIDYINQHLVTTHNALTDPLAWGRMLDMIPK